MSGTNVLGQTYRKILDTTLNLVPGTNPFGQISGKILHTTLNLVPGTNSIFSKINPKKQTPTRHAVSTLDLDPPLLQHQHTIQ